MSRTVIDKRYKVIKKIGSGANGTVYKVRDVQDNAIIALKILSKEKTSSEMIQRFKREFQLLAGLRHPNLCAVNNFGTLKDGRSYFTMEYVDGENIFKASKRLSYKKMYPLIVQLCRALQYIHSKGLIHYDIKPGNVLVQRSENTPCVKLMDFGLAKEKLVRGKTLIRGTFPYIAPEVMKGLAVDHRADLYSLGILLYQMFTKTLFTTKTETNLASFIEQQHKCIVKPLSKIAGDIPRRLEHLLERLLTVEPAARYSQANEIIGEINKLSHPKFDLETEKTLEGYLLSSKFVGREKEMEMLKQFYGASNQGKGKVVLITGDAGVGKSRLLKEFKIFTQLERGYCFTGYAYKERVRPLEPFYDVFKEMIDYIGDGVQLRTSLAVLCKMFPDLVTRRLKSRLPKLAPLGAQQEKLRNFDALCELIRYVASNLSGMTILLEDLHWADALTIQFLEYLGRNLEDTNILICISGRREELEGNEAVDKMMVNLKSEGHFSRIDLRPLDMKTLYSFLDSAITSRSNSPSLVKYFMEKTSGNPYFVEEIMRSLLRMGKVSIGERIEVNDISQITIPATIEGIVNKRIKDLHCDARKVVKYAAVLLREFDYGLMRHLTELKDIGLSKVLWELKRRQILVEEDNRYQFYHATLREAVNKRLNAKEKRDLNYKIAKTLEKITRRKLEKIVEELAYYFINAKDRKRGVIYGLRAAKKSSEQYANEQAIQFYKDVLVLLGDKNPKWRYDILWKLAHLEGIVGYDEEAFKHCYKALNLKNVSIYKKVKIYFEISRIYASKGNYNKVLYFGKKAKRLLKKMKPGRLRTLLEININYLICEAYLSSGDYERACEFNFDIPHFPKAGLKEKEAIREQSNIYHLLASIEYHKGRYGRGDYDKAISYFKKAIKYNKKKKAEELIVSIYNNLGATYLERFDFQNAIVCLQKCIKRAEKIGKHYTRAIALCNLSDIFCERGFYLKALDCSKKALFLSKKIGNFLTTGIALYETGRCFFHLGNYKEAERYVEQALNIFRTPHWDEEKFSVFGYLAEIYQATGDYAKALRLYRKALKNFSEAKYQREVANLLMNIGSVFTEIGEFSKAKRYIKNALKIADTLGLKNVEIEYYLVLCRINIMLEDYAVANDCYEKGIKMAKKLGMKRRILQFLLLSGQIYYHKNRYLEGLKIVNKSVDMAKKMGTKDLHAEALLMKARHEIKQDNLLIVELMEILDEATHVAGGNGCPEILWKVYFERGELLHENGEFSNALDYYEKSVSILKEVSSKIKNKKYANSYLNRPDRKAVFTTIDKM